MKYAYYVMVKFPIANQTDDRLVEKFAELATQQGGQVIIQTREIAWISTLKGLLNRMAENELEDRHRLTLSEQLKREALSQ